MKLHVKIFDFFLKSSIWVAFAVCALTEITCMNFELKTDRPLLGFVFFATIFGYNFIKYFEKEHLSVQHSKILKLSFRKAVLKFKHLHTKEKVTFLMSAFCAIFCAILLFKLTTETKLLLCVPALLSFFYAVSFKEKTLRSTSGLKIYVVGIVWAIVTVILPISEASINMNYDVWITFTQRVVGVLLLLVFLFLEFFKNDVLGINQIIIPLVFVVTLFFLVSSSVKQSKYYASFFVEGIPLLWLLLLLVQ